MSHYAGLVQFILARAERVTAAGQLPLTEAEAAHVRALDFLMPSQDIGRFRTGRSRMLRAYPQLGRLSIEANLRVERVGVASCQRCRLRPRPRSNCLGKEGPVDQSLLVRQARQST